eukprot:m.424877 g.424877  ORF g.424877 m.424877 type:complete len:63 (-) comp21340_c0_seq8:2140-2328(-)
MKCLVLAFPSLDVIALISGWQRVHWFRLRNHYMQLIFISWIKRRKLPRKFNSTVRVEKLSDR